MWTPLRVRCTRVVHGLSDVDPVRVQCTLVVRVLISAGHRTNALTGELALQRTLLATKPNCCRSPYECDDSRAGFAAHALGDVLESVYAHSKAFSELGKIEVEWENQSVAIRFLNPFKSVLIHYKSGAIRNIYFFTYLDWNWLNQISHEIIPIRFLKILCPFQSVSILFLCRDDFQNWNYTLSYKVGSEYYKQY